MRILLCPECAAKPGYMAPHPGEIADGHHWRKVWIPKVKKPASHRVVFNGVPQPELATLLCDACCAPLLNGTPAVAISQWRGGEMAAWEQEFQEP